MKLEIDFDNKLIAVMEYTNIVKLMKFIKQLQNWKEFSLRTNQTVNWYPWYEPYTYTYDDDVYKYGWITITGDSTNFTPFEATSGTLRVELEDAV